MKGLKGLKNMSIEEKLELFDQFDKVIDEANMNVFKVISFETMRRSALQVNVTASTRSFKMTAYDQYQVKDGKCYPLYYEF